MNEPEWDWLFAFYLLFAIALTAAAVYVYHSWYREVTQ